MAMIGRGAAVAAVGKHHHEVHGELAHMAWLGVHASLMTGTRAKIEAFVDWAWDGFTRTGGPHVLDRTAAAAIDWDDDEAVVGSGPRGRSREPLRSGGRRAMVQNAALETVRLSDDEAQLEATFVPGAGMICCSLRHRGEELLAQEGGLAEYEHDGHTMGIPLLYPWANRLAAFDYRIRGRTVRVPHDPELIQLESHGLPIHGVIGGRVAWELTRTPAHDGRSLSARLRWDGSVPELFDVFPFRHDLVYEAHLAAGMPPDRRQHACERRRGRAPGVRLSPVRLACPGFRASAGRSSSRRCGG